MNQIQLFLPCAAGVEDYLAPEVQRITGLTGDSVQKQRGGVAVRASWRDAMLLNLHSRLAQRVLVELSYTQYRSEQDLYNAASNRAAKALRECPKPTIAMIRGFCMGGGMGTAVACDLRIASDDSRFGVPAAKLGVGYRYDRLKQLEALVGPSFTMEIFYTGRQFSAQEALTMGLINRLLPAAELEKYVLDYANTIAGNAPLTIAAVKKSVVEMGKDETKRDIATCDNMVDACFASKDYAEGRDAFMEKRKPVFHGR